MFSKNLRRAFVAIIALPMALSLQGCTDQEALAVLGGVAIVGGAVALGVAASNNDDSYTYHEHNNYYYQQNPPPYYGGYHGGYYGGYNGSCSYYASGCYNPYYRSLKSGKMSADELNEISLAAARYNLPLESAATLKAALNTAVRSQNLQPVLDLGLTRSDLASIANMKMISDSSLNQLASKLSVSQEQARGAVQQMMVDIQASQAQK